MVGLLLLVFGLMPFVLGAFTWRLVRRRDEGGPDEPPPPPPEPEAPLPVVPPSLRRLDREPVRSPRTRRTVPRRV
jgi:hypothetical protein